MRLDEEQVPSVWSMANSPRVNQAERPSGQPSPGGVPMDQQHYLGLEVLLNRGKEHQTALKTLAPDFVAGREAVQRCATWAGQSHFKIARDSGLGRRRPSRLV
jgi:hypothetical protein